MPTFFKINNLEKQSIEVPGTRSEGATGHYRHSAFVGGLVDHIREAPHVKTLYDLFETSASKHSELEFLGRRSYDPVTKTYGRYTWETYAQIRQRINEFGSGLMHINEVVLGSDQLDRWSLGIWSLGRPEWFVSEMSCNYYNNISVPLYDSLGPDAVEYVINHAEVRMVSCSANHIATLLQNSHKLPTLKAIVSMDSFTNPATLPGTANAAEVLRAWGAEKGIKIYDFYEVEALGRAFPRKHIPPKPDDVASLCYTSGTTGQPKGVMLTHRNFIAAVGTNREGMRLGPGDVTISYLPLAHIMGRLSETSASFSGCKIGYFKGDILTLMDDVAELKPTYFSAVPRLLNRLYARLVAATIDAPGLTGALARKGVEVKLANLEAGKGVDHPLWDRLIFNKVKMVLGGRVQVLLTGSAPIAKEVLNFLRVCFGCSVLEGYGSTEGLATATVTMADEYIPGHVGCPRAGCEIRLVDVPAMNYFSTDKPFPRGEIQIRGAMIFKGYYKDEKNTRETLDENGWLATGDIGFVDNRGCFTIIDRKKNIFKLAQGEYIAPEKIENTLTARCKLIMQIYVHGDSLESTLVAVVIPDPETFLPFANAVAGTQVTLADRAGYKRLIDDPKVNAAVMVELEKAGKAGKLRGFEFVKRVHLSTDMFSVENDMMTPTSKVRRPQVREYFSDKIQAMYEDIHRTTTVAKL
ncbi:long-chain acyl-CoA synthetase [Entomortierella parvispora]|uniref:Long-chain acyl-CoA synthetase n=1 Tax=Entomortierella parvispora TaxID=205924 RepID=A0A9P3LU58_9FUNG|nr:long-chain acyl-CoA synthetase [Entomortierella parvispora]